MKTIGFVGAGNMAEAVMQGIIAAKLFAPESVFISDVRPDRLQELQARYQVCPCPDNASLAQQADVVVLAVKPFHLEEALSSLQGHLRESVVVVSVIAGKRIASISDVLGSIPIVRVMPNTPALINEGASALYANDRARPILPKIKALFACVGQALEVESEDLIDAVTAVSGSGPAYYYLMMEAMIDAGVKLGLTTEVATTLVLQTARGAALLAQQADAQGESPAVLTHRVATPGGTTEAALNRFEQGNFRDLVLQALTEAQTRSQKLSAS